MNGYHVSWAPYATWQEPDYRLYTAIASAIMWKRFYGHIDLVCDAATEDAYRRLDLLSLYRNVYKIPDTSSDGIDYFRMWAGKKIPAHLAIPYCPATSVDQDLIIWKPLVENPNAEVQGLHWDDPHWKIYSDYRVHLSKHVPDLQVKITPINCGLVTFRSNDLRAYYCQQAMKAMAGYCSGLPPRQVLEDNSPDTAAMVFSEQQLLSACAITLSRRFDVYLPVAHFEHWRLAFDDALHLQGMGKQYKVDSAARHAYLRHLKNAMQLVRCSEAVDCFHRLQFTDALKSDKPLIIK